MLVIKNQKDFNKAYVDRMAHLQSQWNQDDNATPLQVHVEHRGDTPAMAAYAANGVVRPLLAYHSSPRLTPFPTH